MKIEKIPIYPNRTRALAAFIKCRYCGGEMVQISTKDGGCYGCCEAKKDGCDNKLRISGRGVEDVILGDLEEKFLTVQGQSLLANNSTINARAYYVAHTSIQTVALLGEVAQS